MVNKTVQNVTTIGQTEYNFINFAKSATYTLGTNSPTLFNDDGYPSSTLTANLSLGFSVPSSYGGSTQWVLKWSGTIGQGSTGWQIQTGVTVVSSGGNGYNAPTVISGGGGSAITIRGTNGRMVFTFAAIPGGNNKLSTIFGSGCTFSGFSNLVLCRLSDEPAVDAGSIWNPDYLASLNALGADPLRFMSPATGSSGNETPTNALWTYRTPLTALSYRSARPYVSGIWCGAITNSGNAYTAPSYTDIPVSWSDGDVFMGTVSAAQTSVAVSAVSNSSGKVKLTIASTTGMTTGDPIYYTGYTSTGSVTNTSVGLWSITVIDSTNIELTSGWTTGQPSVYLTYVSSPGNLSTATITSGGRTKKPILGSGTLTSGVLNGISSTGQYMFVYKAVHDAVFVASGLFFTGMNPELAVSLCNTTNKNLWWNLSIYAADSMATSAITYIRDNLNSNLYCVFELSNEMWNSGFTQFIYCFLAAKALNISNSDSFITSWSYQGLQTARLVDLMQPIWSATRTADSFKPVLTNWAVSSFVSNFNTYKCKGNLLDAGSNSVLSAYTGGKSYNQGSPTFNRPVDKCRLISMAPYVIFQKPGYQSMATMLSVASQYASGDTSGAIAAFDALMRTQCDVYNGTSGSNAIYSAYETVCAGYDGARPAGFSNLELWCYEGGHNISLPTIDDYDAASATVSSTVTFNVGSSPSVNWTSNTPVNGTKVSFTSTGNLPTYQGSQITGTNFYVVNAAAGVGFDLCPTDTSPTTPTIITLGGSPTGTATGKSAQYSIDNVAIAWLDSPTVSYWFVKYYLDQFSSVSYPHLKKIAFLQMEGFNTWSLYPAPMDKTPFQMFNGVALYNSGKRRFKVAAS